METAAQALQVEEERAGMATYLVTGGAGFIGSHMVEELVRRGETVRVLDNLATGKTANLARIAGRIDFQEADIRDLGSYFSAFQGRAVRHSSRGAPLRGTLG